MVYSNIRGEEMLVYLSLLEDKQDEPAYEDFYNQYKDKALWIAMGFMEDQYLAENAVHNAFCAAAIHFKKIMALSCQKQGAYFVTIVKNKCRDLLRSEKRYRETVVLDEDTQLEMDVEWDGGVGNELDGVFELTAKIIQTLPDIYQAVLEYRLLYQWSNKDVAQMLKISEDLAAKRFQRGREMVAKTLEKEGYNHG